MSFRTMMACTVLLIAGPAAATMTCTAGGCSGVPTNVLVWESGVVWIIPDINGSTIDNLTCTPINGNAVILDPAEPGFQALYSLVLSAQITGTPIFIRLPDTSEPCVAVYIRVDE